MSWMLADALGLDRQPPPEAVTTSYTVFVRNLVLACSIGIYDHEKDKPQGVRINVELRIEPPGEFGDDFGRVFNYETIVAGIEAIARAGHINLVETLVERIAALCLSDGRVRHARVLAEKLDVYRQAESVGVLIERFANGPAAPAP